MAADPFYRNVSLLLNCNGTNGSTTFRDASLLMNSVTANGNAQLTTVQSKFGGASLALDGAGDYLLTTDNSGGFDFGTGDFTVEAWVRFNSATGDQSVISGVGPTNGDWVLAKSDTGALRWGRNIIAWDVVSPNLSWSNDTWYHLAVTRSSGTLRIFRDGVQQVSASNSQTYNIQNTNLAVGCRQGASGQLSFAQFFNGQIDDVRVTKGVARYTSNFTPPTEEFEDEFAAYFTTSVSTYIANRLSLATSVRQSIPLQLNLRADDRSLKQSISFDPYIGKFRVRGTTKLRAGLAEVARQSIVVLMDEVAGIAVRRQVSNATTGAYSFDNIRGDIRYTVVAYDPEGSLNAVIADNIQAEPMI